MKSLNGGQKVTGAGWMAVWDRRTKSRDQTILSFPAYYYIPDPTDFRKTLPKEETCFFNNENNLDLITKQLGDRAVAAVHPRNKF